MNKDQRYWGPDRDDDCPCGSRRKARSCHALANGGWSAEPWQSELAAGEPTGYSHPRCYARLLNDCSTKISREHYISAGLLKEIGAEPLMQGLPFLEGSKRLSVASLASKMLCERHNNALSPLDAEALRTFAALRRFEANYRDGQAIPAFDSVLISGPLLEAWLLKTAFGFLAAGLVHLEGESVAHWRDNSDEVLLAVLFGDESMPNSWGMWLIPPDRPQAAAADIATQARGVNGEMWSLTVEFGAFMVTLALGVPGGSPIFHPSALIVLKEGAEAAQQPLLIGWPPGLGGDPVITTRVSEMDDWDRSR